MQFTALETMKGSLNTRFYNLSFLKDKLSLFYSTKHIAGSNSVRLQTLKKKQIVIRYTKKILWEIKLGKKICSPLKKKSQQFSSKLGQIDSLSNKLKHIFKSGLQKIVQENYTKQYLIWS